MRYLIDEDLDTSIAIIGRRLGLDVVSAQEAGRKSWTDVRHLRQAAEEARCFVSANRDDFLRLTLQFAASDQPHAGVLIVPYSLRRRGAPVVARALLAFERVRGEFPAA